MLSPVEMKHVESFPSVLRLLLTWELLGELEQKMGSLDRLRSIKFHRVIDNQDLELDAEELWGQLNYQMIHLLGFVPTADWGAGVHMTVFQVCLGLYSFLTRAGQLRAKVAMDPVAATGLKPTFTRRMGVKAIRKYSAKIGHDLAYKLQWEEGSRL